MANRDFIKNQIALLVEGWQDKPYSDVQMKLLESELLKVHITNSDVENAVFYLIKTKQGRQSLPSVDAVCAEVERQRNDRIASEKFTKIEHPMREAEKRLTSELHRLHCKAFLEKMKSGLRTPAEIDSQEARAFRKICDSLLGEIAIEKIADEELRAFTRALPESLQIEYQIVADAVKNRQATYDPFAEP